MFVQIRTSTARPGVIQPRACLKQFLFNKQLIEDVAIKILCRVFAAELKKSSPDKTSTLFLIPTNNQCPHSNTDEIELTTVLTRSRGESHTTQIRGQYI